MGSLKKNVSIISSATLISRIAGFFRDVLIAGLFGTTYVADAFFVAFRLPNLLRKLLGEGALASAFIPVFTDYLENRDKKEADELASTTLNFLIVILLLVSICGVVFAPFLVRVLTLTFSDLTPKHVLAIKLTRIIFPYIFFISLTAFFMGYLNSLNHFFMPAISPVILNIVLIIASLFVCPDLSNRLSVQIFGLAYAVIVAGFLQLLAQILKAVSYGFKYNFSFRKQIEGVKRIGRLIIPATYGMAVTQINILVDTMLAWLLGEGKVSALYYANRLIQLPLGLFGIAISTASFPKISSFIARKDYNSAVGMIFKAIRMMCLIVIPSFVGLMVLANPIIRLLFERGEFKVSATQATAWALYFYAPGLIAFSGVKIVVAVFYSLKDAKIPTVVGIVAMVLNIILNLILMRYLSHGGLALATTISAYINFILLYYILRKRVHGLKTFQLLRDISKMLIAAGLMALSVKFLFSYLTSFTGLRLFFRVILSILCGVVSYFLFLVLLRINVLKEFKE